VIVACAGSSEEDDTTSNNLEEESYNFMFTAKWILLVRRSQSDFRGASVSDASAHINIGVNSLGYCGLFYVKNQESFDFMREIGPVKILESLSK